MKQTIPASARGEAVRKLGAKPFRERKFSSPDPSRKSPIWRSVAHGVADIVSVSTQRQYGVMDMPELPRGYVVEFRYRQRPYPDRPTLSLTILPSREATDEGSVVIFEGVSDLKVIGLDHLSSSKSILVAQDVRHWQHEGVRYAVSDLEGELLTFKCLSWSCSG
jgi:hypothetical protein